MEAGSIEPLDGIYKNAFNLIIGAQGRGKTYHANELIGRNSKYFDRVLRFAPNGSAGEFDGDVSDLVRYLEDRVRKATTLKQDARDAKTILTALETGKTSMVLDAGINRARINYLMEMYPNVHKVGELKPILVLIDDMGGDPVIKRSEAIFNDIARRLRHLQLTIIFNAHQYKDLAPFVRSNTQMLYLHGGLPIRDLKEICKERRVPNVGNYTDLEKRYDGITQSNFYGWFPIDFYGKQKINLNPPAAKPGTGDFVGTRDKQGVEEKEVNDVNGDPLDLSMRANRKRSSLLNRLAESFPIFE